MRFPTRVIALLLLCTALAACDDKPKCRDGERSYDDGDTWTCADGCNYCECRDGELSHTAAGCVAPPGPEAGKLGCGSIDHQHGSEWLCQDTKPDAGCELCSCDEGTVSRAPASCDGAVLVGPY